MADKKAYDKQRYLNNTEKIKERINQYQLNNVEKIKEYRLNNVEKTKEYRKVYRQTENGKKSRRITNWKQLGVISDDFNELHEKYINTTNCDNCDIELIHGMCGSNKKVLDHCHKTGQFRNVLCHCCNVRRK